MPEFSYWKSIWAFINFSLILFIIFYFVLIFAKIRRLESRTKALEDKRNN